MVLECVDTETQLNHEIGEGSEIAYCNLGTLAKCSEIAYCNLGTKLVPRLHYAISEPSPIS